MTGATYAVNIGDSLSKIKGVSEDQVNVGTDPAHIGLDPKIFPSSLPVTEIQKKGLLF